MIESVSEFRALVSNPDLVVRNRCRWETATVDVWFAILETDPDLIDSVVLNKTLPNEVLCWLITHGEARIRCLVATKRKLSADLLDVLAKDTDESVRVRVARNRRVPVSTLQDLSNDGSWVVRAAAQDGLRAKGVLP